MTDRMPCRISDGPQEPGDIPYTSSEDSERFSYRPERFTECQMAEALDEIYPGEWRERFPDISVGFEVLDCDDLREAAEDIRERDNAELQRQELRGALEDIAQTNLSDLPFLLKVQAN